MNSESVWKVLDFVAGFGRSWDQNLGALPFIPLLPLKNPALRGRSPRTCIEYWSVQQSHICCVPQNSPVVRPLLGLPGHRVVPPASALDPAVAAARASNRRHLRRRLRHVHHHVQYQTERPSRLRAETVAAAVAAETAALARVSTSASQTVAAFAARAAPAADNRAAACGTD